MQTKSIDPFFNRTHSKEYNCFHFVREVWLALTGEDVFAKLTGLTGAFADWKVTLQGLKGFERLESPANPSIVLMQRRGYGPHVGIYLDRRILHLHLRGVEFQPLCVAREYFTNIRYYR